MTANRTPAWWRVIDWRTVLAAGLPAWLLVLGVVAWFKLTKREPVVVRSFPPSSLTAEAETAPMARLAVEESPTPQAARELAALPRPSSEDAPLPRLARDDADAEPVAARLLDPAKPWAWDARPVPDDCRKHGTAVHFTKSTLEAVKQARATDKLVFVLHLSGNIEDDGFT